MNDMRAVIVPKSDQINADSLVTGPITIAISNVTIRPGTEQPVSVHYDRDEGKPYKPCKSMARVLVHCWGADANAYIGRRMTLYCDPTVKWGGMAVGGIRISHMSHINGKQTMALTETKGKKTIFTVMPLPDVAPPTQAPSMADWIAARRTELEGAQIRPQVDAIIERMMATYGDAGPKAKAAMDKMFNDARERTAPPGNEIENDPFPDDLPSQDAA